MGVTLKMMKKFALLSIILLLTSLFAGISLAQTTDITITPNNPVVGDASGRVFFFGNGT